MTDVEVDQSGKIEELAVDTFLAFSNGLSGAIRIPAAVKRAGLDFLRRRRVPPKTRYLRMLAAGFYLLLQDDLAKLAYITIDIEFAGREGDLQGMLLILIWRRFPHFSKERLVFRRIGKKSPAHQVALATYQGKRPVEKAITEEAFIAVLK